MLGKKKVGLEPTAQVETKVVSVTTINSSKTTIVTQSANGLKSYMGCQSSMMKLIKTTTAAETQPAQKGKTPIMFGQLKKKGPQNSLLK